MISQPRKAKNIYIYFSPLASLRPKIIRQEKSLQSISLKKQSSVPLMVADVITFRDRTEVTGPGCSRAFPSHCHLSWHVNGRFWITALSLGRGRGTESVHTTLSDSQTFPIYIPLISSNRPDSSKALLRRPASQWRLLNVSPRIISYVFSSILKQSAVLLVMVLF